MLIGSVGYACDQGLGHLNKWFYDAGIVNEVMIFQHPSRNRPTHREWFPGASVLVRRPFRGPEVEVFLSKVKTVLFYESPFDWEFMRLCKNKGVKTCIMSMYEWWPERPPHLPDMIICPSVLDKDYFPHGHFIPIPAHTKYWKPRTKALRFLHNSGHIGSRNHKGTEELIKAISLVKSPIELTIRSQEPAGLLRLLSSCPGVTNDPRVKIETGTVPYENLFDGYDVLVAPEKYNGASLPLQEAYAAGMLVITTDRRPTNTWLPTEPMIKPSRYDRARVAGGYLEFDEAIVEPAEIARTIDEWYGRDIEEFSLRGKAWAEANSWEALKPRYLEVLRGNL